MKNCENNDEKSIYLDLYKICVEQTNHTSERRMKTNNFFLLLNSAIISAVVALSTKEVDKFNSSLIYLCIGIFGMILCYCWFSILTHYRNINRAKFNVITQIEEKFPIQCYVLEKEEVRCRPEYKALSKTEQILALLFGLAYFLLFIIPVATLILQQCINKI